MNIDINLLTNRGNYYRIENLFQKGRRITVGLGIVTMILLAVLLFFKQSTRAQIEARIQQKQELEADLATFDERTQKIKLIGNKLIEMNKIQKEAPDFGSYYTTIEKYLPTDPSQGELKKVSLNSPASAVIELDFPDILALTRFMGVVESDEFLNDFESIRFSNIVFTKGNDDLSLTIHVTFGNET